MDKEKRNRKTRRKLQGGYTSGLEKSNTQIRKCLAIITWFLVLKNLWLSTTDLSCNWVNAYKNQSYPNW